MSNITLELASLLNKPNANNIIYETKSLKKALKKIKKEKIYIYNKTQENIDNKNKDDIVGVSKNFKIKKDKIYVEAELFDNFESTENNYLFCGLIAELNNEGTKAVISNIDNFYILIDKESNDYYKSLRK